MNRFPAPLPLARLSRALGVLALAAALTQGLIGCRPPAGEEREMRVGEVTIAENPAGPPRELQKYFRYPNGRAVLSSVYMAGSFLSTPEGVMIYETDDAPETVGAFYFDVIKKEDWTVIQTAENPDERLIMAESRFRKIVTVIIRDKNPTRIKIYFKRSDSE